MNHDGGHRDSFTDGVAVGAEVRAARSQATSGGRLTASRTDARDGKRPGLGGLWLLVVPLACCSGPLLIAALAASGALAWGALGLGAGLLAAVALLVIRHRCRRSACCEPDMTGWAHEGRPAASRRPAE
jgi:hypothetical protein